MLELLDRRIRCCKNCSLYKTRKFAVVGEGFKEAKIMFIGEAPGAEEDEIGIPFVGQAGAVFDELLRHIDLKRTEVYITNVLKCRPLKNANPTPEQIRICTRWLNVQIDIIKPLIIVSLGNFATDYIFKKFGLEDKLQGITKIKGKVFKSKNSYKLFIIPLFHPAVATYFPSKINELKMDFEILINYNKFEELAEC